jgi:hypothetical protein
VSGRPNRRTVVRRSACIAAAGAMVLTGVVAIPAQANTPTSSRTGLASRGSGVLSARLAQLATQGLQSASVTARALSLPTTGGGSLSTDDAGRVAVLVNLNSTSTATVDRLKALGTVLNVSTAMSRATLQIDPAELRVLAATAGVTYADVAVLPQLASTPTASTFALSGTKTAAGKVVCNPVKSESDVQLRAALARVNSKVNGSGITVGVLSDSYDKSPSTTIKAATDVKAGELPGNGNPCGFTSPVYVHDDTAGGSDEGRAMMQSIHDLAPGAKLMFATASPTEDVMATNIRWLANHGATVIVDDVSYYEEPFFQSGVVDEAIYYATHSKGVSYFSSAGNSNVIFNRRNVSSWESKRQTAADVACVPLTRNGAVYLPNSKNCISFDGLLRQTYQMTIAPGGSVTPVIQWAEPINGVTDDYDVYLFDKNTGAILAGSENDQAANPTPAEYFGWRNTGTSSRVVSIEIAHYSGTGHPRLKMVMMDLQGLAALQDYQSTSYATVGPTIFGHNGGPDTISVAAVPYYNLRSPESYSSRGPVTHYFGPVTGTGPATALVSPEGINAPELTATDGNATSFFGDVINGVYRFFGTSDAAPNAAAVAALLRSLHPTISAAHVQSILQTSAAPVGTQPATAVGAGLVDALAALAGTRQLGRPAAATAINLKPGRGTVTLHFTAPSNTGHLRIISYTATCLSTALRAAKRSVTFAGGAVKVVGLTPGQAYRCTITATNVLGSQRSASSGAFKA